MTSGVFPVRLLAAVLFALAPVAAAQEPVGSFGDTIRLRGTLDNARVRFERDGKGTVAFLGGSITEMEGYRPLVCEGLRKRFPHTDFTFINAGISSTCSTTGAFRLQRDVFGAGPVDLLFVEFAVNDDQDAHHGRAECIRGLEGIVRQARDRNPNIDVVVTFFVNEPMLATLRSGGVPLSIEAHEAVAARYDVSTVNLAREVAAEIESGSLTWKQYGGVHPAAFGNAICGRMIEELLNRAWRMPLEASARPVAHPMAAPLDPLNYAAGRFVDPALAEPRDGWTLGIPEWKKIEGSMRPRYATAAVLSASEPGAELRLSFEGTAVGAFVLAGPDAGVVEARIDEGPVRQIDLYHRFSKGLHYPRTVMLGTDLAPGRHTLTLRVAEKTSSGGHAVRIMQFTAN